jgi:hypothetical protein
MRLSIPSAALWLALLAAGCCHVNRLDEQPAPIGELQLQQLNDPAVSLHFTRKMNSRTKQLVGPLLRVNRAVLKFDDLIQQLAGGRLRQAIAEQLPQVLARELGWRRGDEGVILVIEPDEVVFTAKDQETPVTLIWRLRVGLCRSADEALIWRRCIDWRQELGGLSMLELLHMSESQRQRLLRELVSGLGAHLVRLLIEDGVEPAAS